MYDELVAKVNNIDTHGFVLKTKFNIDKTVIKTFLMLLSLLKKQSIMLKLGIKK